MSRFSMYFKGNIEIIFNGALINVASIKDEWYEDVAAPADLISYLKKSRIKADVFTFWQRLPETKPKFEYYMEWDNVAALSIKSYDHWWEKQINAKTRNMIRKAQKQGVEILSSQFDDAFINGMTEIFNETPIRQGKPFWHYGKSFETVKREFSFNLHRESLFGAYHGGELIGFLMLANVGQFAITTQIISKIAHRDKAPNNALLAKAVEQTAMNKTPYLVYAKWDDGSLGDFKRSNGFEKIALPRYYIPLTLKGSIALKLKLHHGIIGIVPEQLRDVLKEIRKKWYSKNYLVSNR